MWWSRHKISEVRVLERAVLCRLLENVGELRGKDDGFGVKGKWRQ